ncbi:MAG: hypothetical protein LBK04_06695 [Clostridiales Family XIII bacterium]|jgi:hypothetical protein|nr:hypothetical protein [Clostridiales Family XIII bacterium]
MGHSLIKATIIPEVVKLIALNEKMTEEQALSRYYGSNTAAALDDEETGLYGQSVLYIYSLYVQETNPQIQSGETKK